MQHYSFLTNQLFTHSLTYISYQMRPLWRNSKLIMSLSFLHIFFCEFLHFSHVSIDTVAHLSACSGLLKAWNSTYISPLESTEHKKLLMKDNIQKFKSEREWSTESIKFISMINFCLLLSQINVWHFLPVESCFVGRRFIGSRPIYNSACFVSHVVSLSWLAVILGVSP